MLGVQNIRLPINLILQTQCDAKWHSATCASCSRKKNAIAPKVGRQLAGVTGYRGSPRRSGFSNAARGTALKAVDVTFRRVERRSRRHGIWGAQYAELRGKYDGVFSLWYGKGRVDRSGDAMRHANMAGAKARVAAMGDDHTGESSTTLHQSDFAMVDAHIPIVSPAGVQEILDYGHYAFELSRFSGLWVGLNNEGHHRSHLSCGRRSQQDNFRAPEIALPEGLNIRLVDTPTEMEARLLDHKAAAAEAFARANRMDKRGIGEKGAKIGIVAAGKNWLDVTHAMSALNIDNNLAKKLGITTYKVVQTWPGQTKSDRMGGGTDLIVVVEEKRKLIEGR